MATAPTPHPQGKIMRLLAHGGGTIVMDAKSDSVASSRNYQERTHA
jgi:hypothetical protein